MAIYIFKRNWVELGFDRSDKRIIFLTKTNKEKRERLMMRYRLVDGNNSINEISESVIVIYNKGVSFAKCSKLIANAHRFGARLSVKHPLQSVPDIVRSGTFNHIS